jgi:putative ubiquitin-RnfH superfamily antitoxin RatB of RatAB toxin-antitoxin module
VAKPITVHIYWSPAPRSIRSITLTLPAEATALQAIELARQTAQPPGSLPSDATFAIWNRKANASTVLHDGDRLELLRHLTVDPKVARRQRFKRQGKGRTGLFANRKSGSAAGY